MRYDRPLGCGATADDRRPRRVDLDLELAPWDASATVRRPDLVVVRRTELDQVKSAGGVVRASGAVLVVEVGLLGSRRTDRLIKRAEYADSGIAYYWILDERLSLRACRLSGSAYEDGDNTTDTVQVGESFDVQLPLRTLV